LRGRRGILHTGHCLYEAATSRVSVSTVKTFVHFADATDAEIDLYVGSGDPLAAAGGFTIDALGGWFVEGISGDHHNVVGLSLPVLRRMLRELGYTIADIGYPPRLPSRFARTSGWTGASCPTSKPARPTARSCYCCTACCRTARPGCRRSRRWPIT